MTDSVSITPEAPPGWDEATVERHGGHVYQSTAWAEHRRSSGWQPLFVSIGEARVLALSRSWPLVGGGSAYIPRGPAPTVPSDRLGEVLWATTRALAADGIDVVAADPEVPASDMTWASWLRRAGFHEIDEIQPSRHRLTLPLGEGATDETVLAGISKSTRQRIRKAER
ncbi:MAG TPA: hypothetical protein VKA85_10070, partial [Candidatus Limnocylindrales bacterium]|nr:hypothetical protein [Candidatus Limnocylindrales bacterium]